MSTQSASIKRTAARQSEIGRRIILFILLWAAVSPCSARGGEGGVTAWLGSLFPEAVREVSATHGLSPFVQNKPGLTLSSPRTRVILIHGLDEPGRVWLNLAPALAQQGFSVWLMTYPNDQDIRVSARFFYQELEKKGWGQSGGTDTAVVAHSMGGLVTRQMLTDPKIDYTGGVREGRVPAVSRLIMIGTPNHGAALARFRIIMEIREQVLNLVHGHGSWLQGFFDGDGAAGRQLLPGSKFLTRLNERPRPPGVSMTVIAGVLSSWLPQGDGLVSVASARMDNIPLYPVKGNHLTIVRNLTRDSSRIPPAVPLVLSLLSP